MKLPALVLSLLLVPATLPALAQALPDGIDETTWAAIERQIEAEVDRNLIASKPDFDRGAFGSEHGLVRTAVLDFDSLGFPGQSTEGPRFGLSVAIDGDWIVVGAPGTIWNDFDHGIAAHGSVFVFRRGDGGWTLHQLMEGAYSPSGTRCGHAVVLQMPILVIGCPEAENAAGTQTIGVVRYARYNANDDWFYVNAHINGTSNGRCGSALAISADYLAVGCPTVATSNQGGRVRIYRFNHVNNSISLEATLSPPNAMENARFGDSVALNQSLAMPPRLAAGLPLRSPGVLIASGGVHVFERSTDGGTPSWTQSAFVTAPTQNSFALFGQSVDLVRSSLLVGAPNDFCPAETQRCGRVFRFARSGSNWSFAEAGFPTNVPGGASAGQQPGMLFGAAVAFGFDFNIAVAAPNTDGIRAATGTAAAEVGLVELRRPASGNNYNANSYHGVVRPAPLLITTLNGGHLDSAVDFSVGSSRMAVGYPDVGSSLPAPGTRRGQVWIYELDLLFADGFQAP